MKQGFMFLVLMTVVVIGTGLLTVMYDNADRIDSLVITDDMLVFETSYAVDADKADSALNTILLTLDVPYPNMDSLKYVWNHCIYNPDNEAYVIEVAFNLYKLPEDVTQEEFNSRYN